MGAGLWLWRGSRGSESASNPTIAAWALLLGCALAPACATAQQAYKWTDGQGQTHYSDHAPTGQASSSVNLPKTHVSTQTPAPASVPSPSDVDAPDVSGGPPNDSNGTTVAADPYVLRNLRAQQQQSQAAAAKASDKALVAKCNARRDSYCGEGADEIRKREQVLNAPQPGRYRCVPVMGHGCMQTYTPPPPQPQPGIKNAPKRH